MDVFAIAEAVAEEVDDHVPGVRQLYDTPMRVEELHRPPNYWFEMICLEEDFKARLRVALVAAAAAAAGAASESEVAAAAAAAVAAAAAAALSSDSESEWQPSEIGSDSDGEILEYSESDSESGSGSESDSDFEPSHKKARVMAEDVPCSAAAAHPPGTGEARECVVCFQAITQYTMLRPCGHMNVCGPCGRQLDDCPVCRTPIIGRHKAFF